MPKLFTPAFSRAKDRRTGNRPYIIVGINWGGGVIHYSTRTLTVGSITADGKILSMSAVSQTSKSQNSGSSSTVTLTLDDGNNDLRSKIDITRLEKREAIIYQGIEGLSSKDLAVLLYGQVTGPISWDEGNRTLTFSITSDIETKDVGFSPTPNDFPDLATDAYNVPWPMVFGTVKNVPAVRIRKPVRAVLASGISFINDVARINTIQVSYKEKGKIISGTMDELTSGVECMIRDTNTGEDNTIHLEEQQDGDLSTMPVGEDVMLDVDGVRFKGRYDNNTKTFKVSQANVPLYSNLKVGDRDIDDPAEKQAIKDKERATQGIYFWLPESADYVDITGCYIYFKSPFNWQARCYRIVSQVGRKCQLDRYYETAQGVEKLLTSTDTIEAVYPIARSGHTSYELERRFNDGAFEWTPKHTDAKAALRERQKNVPYWSRPSGTEVKRGETDPEIYIVSCVPLEEIYSVSGIKKESLEVGKDLEIYRQLTSPNYTVQLESNFQVNGDFASAILLKTPLKDLDEGKWSDRLFVSCKSTIGPNVSSIITYILERFTDYRIDSTSFANVQAQINSYPAHFAYTDRENALRVCEEIAWQARCALILDNQTAYLRYLGAQGDSSMTLDTSNIKLKSVAFSYSDTTEIITRLLGSWTPDYRDAPKANKYNAARTRRTREIIRALTDDSRVTENQTKLEIYENNIDVYGLKSQEAKFFIYNNQASVIKGLNFWGPRFSNSWKTLKLTTFLPALHLQVFDTVYINLPEFFNFGIYGVVLATTYNPQTFEIELEIWLPIKAGDLTVAGDAYGT